MLPFKNNVITFPRLLLAGLLLGGVATLTWLILIRPGHTPNPLPQDIKVAGMKLLTKVQYRHSIRDIFGGTIELPGSLVTPNRREHGLLAVGAAKVSVSSMGLEVADKLARDIAAQVVSGRHRDELIPCGPASENAFDTECAQRFITKVGRLLYRRPLTEVELQRQLQVAAVTFEQKNSFYAGLEKSLAHMLASPNFLFRIEQAVPDSDSDDIYTLTAFARASRISFLLWNSTPDSVLLDAAERGELYNRNGLQKQIDRMMLSPRLEDGVRAFFSDMLAFDGEKGFDSFTKDLTLFPKFSAQIAEQMREQIQLTLIDHLLYRDDDYRDLFTTPRTFLTPPLAAMLSIPLIQQNTNSSPDRWLPYEFSPDDPRVGITSLPGFVSLHAHPGRTSPTLRGKAVRENLLCQEVPPPPGDVDFNLFLDDENPDYKTTRQRLTAHATVPACAGCHKITDPIGLAMETFDAVGAYRRKENGVVIDTTGELDGVPYENSAGLGKALRNNPSVVSCLVNRVYAYGAGNEPMIEDRKWLRQLVREFSDDGYRFGALLRRMASSEKFHRAKFHQSPDRQALNNKAPGQKSLIRNGGKSPVFAAK